MKSAFAAILPAAVLLASWPALAQTPSNAEFATTTLDLSATGEVSVPPDHATLDLGVTIQAPNAAAAVRQDAQTMTQVLAALKAQGVADRDVRTSGLSVQPQYIFAPNTPRRLNGYEAANRVTVTVQDPSRLGALVDAAVAAGANDVGGIAFALKDPQAVQDEARLEAVKALAARADLYAKAAGYRVARLVNLTEGQRFVPGPQAQLAEVVVTGVRRGAPTPVAAGDITIRVQVSATYELTR
jgi:uncharacterized protein YggE